MPAPLVPIALGAAKSLAPWYAGMGAAGMGMFYGGLRGMGIDPLAGRGETMNERRGLTPAGAAPRAAARGEFQGPAFGNVQGNPRVGGGNAGRSTAAQWMQPAPAPAAQGNPRLPGGRNVAIVTPRSQAQNRALDQAAQNAGMPAWNWKAEENAAVFQAAEERAKAAAAAREAQGGRGYITADNLPTAMDHSQGEYWQGADMKAWAAANPELAKQAMARAGYDPQAQQAQNLQGLAAAAARPPVAAPGVAQGSEWSFANSPNPAVQPLAAAAAAVPGYDIETMRGPDFAAPPQAPSMPLTRDESFPVPNGSVLPGGGQVIDDAAQERLRLYMQRIKDMNPSEWNWGRRVH
jgi:hypothetical protein